MKKLFSLVLAVAMVMSLAAVSFAADNLIDDVDFTTFYTESDGVLSLGTGDVIIPFGKTIFFPILDTADAQVSSYDLVKGVKPQLTYEMGSSYIESVEIVKKKISGTTAYYYYVAYKVKSSTSTSKYDVIGTLKMKKSGQVAADSALIEGTDFSFQVGYASVSAASDGITTFTLTDSAKVYAFGSAAPKFGEDEEFEIELYGDAGYFVVNTIGQGKLVLFSTTKFNSDVAALYPEANLDFVNGNGASFNKTGDLYLFADEDTFLYQLKADGTLAKVKAEYDEYEEAWLVKTRTLGSYVISDVELNLAPAVVEPTTPAEPANPGTGAAA